ncbi:FmdE family protein [Methanothermobacter sp.]|uniref:FmdE family protein n=1 Tax=Methanothermobacter sp. TaxID=1884223 RepID=UPI003C77601D
MRKLFLVSVLLLPLLMTGSVAAADNTTCEVGVLVSYQYSDDTNRINPTFEITDSGVGLNYTRTYDPSSGYTKLVFQRTNISSANLTLTVRAPGYITAERRLNLTLNPNDPRDTRYYASLNLVLNATEAYRLGRDVTERADRILNFTGGGEVLVITTAGLVKYRNMTTEDVIEGILNRAGGVISYGKANILTLRRTAVDPLCTAFIIKKGNDLLMAFYRNNTLVYLGTISQNMTIAQWNNLTSRLGEDAFPFASLANAWAVGAPADLLKQAAFHGHMCLGTISGYAMSKTLYMYYPPLQDWSTGSPIEITNYVTIGVPGGSDDDALILALDNTPGKRSYLGFDTSGTGADASMVGFIRWNSRTNTGTLVVMKFDQQALIDLYKRETGAAAVSELKFNAWLVKKVTQNPASLVTIVKELDNLTADQYYYLAGREVNYNQVNETHGLDMEYINRLNLPNATRETPAASDGGLSYSELREIGKRAAEMAKNIFMADRGVNLERDSLNIAVLTSAGYVYLNGTPTDACYEGIFEVLGSRLSRKNLLPVHSPFYKPLWFTFVLKGADGKTLDSVYITYNPTTGALTAGATPDGIRVNDIGPAALNDAARDTANAGIFGSSYFSIESIANAWKYNIPYDQLVTFLFHNHVCPGVQPGFFITEYAFENYPLEAGQQYQWFGTSIYCKDDALLYLMGVSPGTGTYFAKRVLQDELESPMIPGGSEEGILILWDPVKKVGKAIMISFRWPQFDLSDCTTRNAMFEKWAAAFIMLYSGQTPDYMTSPMVLTKEVEKWITEDELRVIQGGADGNPLAYLRSIPARSLDDLIPVNNGGSQSGTQGGVPGGSTDASTGGVSSGSHGVTNGHAGYSPGVDRSASPAAVSAASEVSEESPVEGKRAYEVKNATSSSSGGDSSWYVYGIVGVLVAAGLVAFGFLRGGAGK